MIDQDVQEFKKLNPFTHQDDKILMVSFILTGLYFQFKKLN